jgi:hypothetical protein
LSRSRVISCQSKQNGVIVANECLEARIGDVFLQQAIDVSGFIHLSALGEVAGTLVERLDTLVRTWRDILRPLTVLLFSVPLAHAPPSSLKGDTSSDGHGGM